MKAVILSVETESQEKKRSGPMTLIAGKPFVEHQVNYLKDNGLEDIILTVNSQEIALQSHFGDGTRFGVNLTYSQEDLPLGGGGAIKNAEKYIDGSFLVLSGDSLSDIDLEDFLDRHKSNTNALGSIVLSQVQDTKGYGSVLIKEDRVLEFKKSGHSGPGLINSGIYVFNPEVFNLIHSERKISLEREVLPKIAIAKKLYGNIQDGYFVSISNPDTYDKFKQAFLKKLQIPSGQTIREAMELIDKNRTDLLFVVNNDEIMQGILNNKIIRKFIIGNGNVSASVEDAMISNPKIIGNTRQTEEDLKKLLSSGTSHLPILDDQGRVYDIRFPKVELKEQNFQTISGKSPLRISFAGGGTDMPYYFEENGGVVISTTIDKYCHITATKRADTKIIIESDLYEKPSVSDIRNLEYNGEFDLVKAVFNLVNPGFGADLYLHNDISPERGLGSSASFASLVTKVLGSLKGISYDDEQIAEIAYRAEADELGITGGKQDQYAAVFGGFNWMEFEKGDTKIIHPLRLRQDTLDELLNRTTLCYTGQSHESKIQQDSQKQNYQKDRDEISKRLDRLKSIAYEIKDNLLSAKPNFSKMGELLHESWQYKRSLSDGVSNSGIDLLYETGINNGSYGGKVLGSGGGGYVLFLHPPQRRNRVVRALQNEGGEILNFNFSDNGTTIWDGK